MKANEEILSSHAQRFRTDVYKISEQTNQLVEVTETLKIGLENTKFQTADCSTNIKQLEVKVQLVQRAGASRSRKQESSNFVLKFLSRLLIIFLSVLYSVARLISNNMGNAPKIQLPPPPPPPPSSSKITKVPLSSSKQAVPPLFEGNNAHTNQLGSMRKNNSGLFNENLLALDEIMETENTNKKEIQIEDNVVSNRNMKKAFRNLETMTQEIDELLLQKDAK